MRTGIANLPLHYGSAPRWLFSRMTNLAREITIVIVREFGPEMMLEKLSDPFWFQSFGCVLGFDWHSSGLTTTVTGALKQGIKDIENDLGLFVCGGKGRTSRKTPDEILQKSLSIKFDNYKCELGEQKWVASAFRKPDAPRKKRTSFADKRAFKPDFQQLVYASKMSAKVDNTAVQDGYQLYHHLFVFTKNNKWSVIQQGMHNYNNYARRYHWLGDKVDDFVNEPQVAICSDNKSQTLDLTANESDETRQGSTYIANQLPEKSIADLKKIHQSLHLSKHHEVFVRDLKPESLKKIYLKTYENQPANFEQLLGIRGVGPKTIRALSLISELIYGTKPSYQDPVKYSFAHGGKDGYPYPVNRKNYDQSIHILKTAVAKAKINNREKLNAFRKLALIN